MKVEDVLEKSKTVEDLEKKEVEPEKLKKVSGSGELFNDGMDIYAVESDDNKVGTILNLPNAGMIFNVPLGS